MNCEFAEKVSMLIDGELPKSEIGAVTAHIADCAECREMQEDFLFFREQIKAEAASFKVVEQAKAQILPPTPRKWWKKGISIPVPALALILLIIGVSGVWLWRADFRQEKEFTAVNSPVNPAISAPTKIEQSPNEMSLARFDTGGRAEIYITPAAAAKKAAQ